jgi:hypothetical protein
MRLVSYYYNGVEGNEELHENEGIDQPVAGDVIERAGEYWTVLEVRAGETAEAEGTRKVKVFLTRPHT